MSKAKEKSLPRQIADASDHLDRMTSAYLAKLQAFTDGLPQAVREGLAKLKDEDDTE